VNDEHLIA